MVFIKLTFKINRKNWFIRISFRKNLVFVRKKKLNGLKA
jgi:hypothetical protein